MFILIQHLEYTGQQVLSSEIIDSENLLARGKCTKDKYLVNFKPKHSKYFCTVKQHPDKWKYTSLSTSKIRIGIIKYLYIKSTGERKLRNIFEQSAMF